jgi:hypothetical protein
MVVPDKSDADATLLQKRGDEKNGGGKGENAKRGVLVQKKP